MLIRGFMACFPPYGEAETWCRRFEHYRPWTESKTVRGEKTADSRTSSLPDPSSRISCGNADTFKKKLITGRLKRIIDSGPPGRFAELPARAVSRLNKQG
jgi:hypothetical protein